MEIVKGYVITFMLLLPVLIVYNAIGNSETFVNILLWIYSALCGWMGMSLQYKFKIL